MIWLRIFIAFFLVAGAAMICGLVLLLWAAVLSAWSPAFAAPTEGDGLVPLTRCASQAVVFGDYFPGFLPRFIGGAGDSAVMLLVAPDHRWALVEVYSERLVCVRHVGFGGSWVNYRYE